MARQAAQRESSVCGDAVEREIETVILETPIGRMVLQTCSRGLHRLYQEEDITDKNFLPSSSTAVTLLGATVKDAACKAHVDFTLNWLKRYFHDAISISHLNLPSLCSVLKKVPLFRDRVLLCLAKSVPAGKVVTYGELAKLTGSAGAQQAVGTAMARNPFQLIVPCHRVIKSGQKVGKYSGGCRNSVKVWLLKHEGFSIDENGTVSAM